MESSTLGKGERGFWKKSHYFCPGLSENRRKNEKERWYFIKTEGKIEFHLVIKGRLSVWKVVLNNVRVKMGLEGKCHTLNSGVVF